LQNKCDLTEFEEGVGGPDGIVYAEIPLSEETHSVNAKSDEEIQVDLNADGVFDGHIVEDFEDLVYE